MRRPCARLADAFWQHGRAAQVFSGLDLGPVVERRARRQAGGGIPVNQPHARRAGGPPAGGSHVAGAASDHAISEEEKKLCTALGRRLAATAVKLAAR